MLVRAIIRFIQDTTSIVVFLNYNKHSQQQNNLFNILVPCALFFAEVIWESFCFLFCFFKVAGSLKT